MAASHRVKYPEYALWCFTLSVALLPVGLGGNRALSIGLLQLGLFASCLFMVMGNDLWQDVQFFKRLRVALGLIALVLVWTLLQTLPFVPDSWKHPLWQEAAGVLSVPVHGAISVSPEDAVKGITRLITYIACGLLSYVLAQDPRRARKMIQVFWLSGAAISAYGLIVYILELNKILWFDKWAYQNDLTATFVNHNHFAIYAGMVMICGLALLIRTWQEQVMRQKPHQRIEAFYAWLVEQGLPQGFLLIMVMACIVFSHSRAGLLLSLGGMGAYLFFYQLYLRAWGRAAVLAVLAIMIPAIVLVIAMHTSERFSVLFSDYSSLDRLKVYKLSWHALLDNPWFGYGINGFEPEFRLYQQNMIMEFNHAHNDWLESLLDLGIPMGLMMWSAIALLLSGLLHGILYRRQNGMFPSLALAASLMVLGHGFVDFSLQIPGVVMPWAALLGIGLAHSWKQSERKAAAGD